ncbi:hypothetical protein [Tolypothrix sp. VBCCA 56010]|uniref:hypothetical protein n=1 Tax=Tolypothrix sp. VBCCA 56010 TaxID=3137731 RepID=UPI003D7DD5CB
MGNGEAVRSWGLPKWSICRQWAMGKEKRIITNDHLYDTPCPMPHAPCPMPYAPCPMHDAPCPMP